MLCSSAVYKIIIPLFFLLVAADGLTSLQCTEGHTSLNTKSVGVGSLEIEKDRIPSPSLPPLSSLSSSSSSSLSSSPTTNKTFNRRAALSNILITGGITLCSLSFINIKPVLARVPGSADITEAVQQIRDAAQDLRKLQQDWGIYATIDSEGRAGNNTAGARRILGGIAPQAGQAAIEVAKVTPLYRIDGAFSAIRKAAIDSDDVNSWGYRLDLTSFEEIAERVLFEIQKADGDFYGVSFASKGTTQINGIYTEAKAQVDRGALDLEEMIKLLKNAGAPGL